MTTTTYYELSIVEGEDIVNPLTIDNPNYEKIDEVLHDNAVAGVTLATEIANATVHAINRENSECAVIRFIATSEWKAGDTATVDGVTVTALLPSGETLPDGAYVINANVLCILTGTNLTIYAERKKTENANEIKYNITTVESELNKLNSNLAIKRFTFTSVDSSRYNITADIINGVLYVKAQVNVPPMNEWSTATIGAINGWIGREIRYVCPMVSIGENIMSADLQIDSDGTVKVTSQGAITGNNWLYGTSAIVL